MGEPGAQENRIRFGCGFVFGFLLGGLSNFRHLASHGYYLLASTALIGLLCGIFAVRQGDKFWYSLLHGSAGDNKHLCYYH